MAIDDTRSSREESLGARAESPMITGESEDLARAEATRLQVLRDVDTVKHAIHDGLATLHTAERDLDFQYFVAGLRKLLAGGLLAKDMADEMERRYGRDAVSL
jgi:hypothetical protein